MGRISEGAIFGGLGGMSNRPLLNTMRKAYTTFVEGIADGRPDPFVKLDEIYTMEEPSEDSVSTDALDVFSLISAKAPMHDIAAKAESHLDDPDYGTKDIGYGITWKDITEWAKRGAMCEGIGSKFAAPLALAAGIGAGVGLSSDRAHDMASNFVDDVKHNWQAAGNYNSAMSSASKWNASADLLGNWKYVDRSEKPGIYSDSLNHTNLNELEGERNEVLPGETIKVGWKVSPDGTTVMSTVTGRVYKPTKSFFDKDFDRSDLGKPVGVGVLYIDKTLDDVAFPWDVEALYGK